MALLELPARRRVLAIGAGMALLGAVTVGPAYAGSDHDDDHYDYYYVVCSDYSSGFYDYDKDRYDDDKGRDKDDGDDSGNTDGPVVPTTDTATTDVAADVVDTVTDVVTDITSTDVASTDVASTDVASTDTSNFTSSTVGLISSDRPYYSYRCYDDHRSGHRWYEHRTVGKVEATKVRTVPKGGVDTGN